MIAALDNNISFSEPKINGVLLFIDEELRIERKTPAIFNQERLIYSQFSLKVF